LDKAADQFSKKTHFWFNKIKVPRGEE